MINKRDVNKIIELHEKLCEPEVYSYRKRLPDNVDEMVKIVNKHFNCNIKIEDVLTANGPVKKKFFGKYEYSIFMVTRRFFYFCNHFTTEKEYPAIPIDKLESAKAEDGYLVVTHVNGKKREILVRKPEYFVAFFDALFKIRDDANAEEAKKTSIEKRRTLPNPKVAPKSAPVTTPKKTPPKPVPIPVPKEEPKKEYSVVSDLELKEKFDKAVKCYINENYGDAHKLFTELLGKKHPGAAFYMAQMISEGILKGKESPFVSAYVFYTQAINWGADSEWALKAKALRARYKILSLVPNDLIEENDSVKELYSCAEKDYKYYMNIVEYTYAGFIPHTNFFDVAKCYNGFYEGSKNIRDTFEEILKKVSIAEALRYFMYLMNRAKYDDFDWSELDKISERFPIFDKENFSHKIVEFVSFKSDETVIFKNKDGSTFEYPVNELEGLYKFFDPGDQCDYYSWYDMTPLIIINFDNDNDDD